MKATTVIYANTLAMQYASRLDGERLRRLVEAPTVADALKMLGDYGYSYSAGQSIDGFVVAETNRLIEFIEEYCPNEKWEKALLAGFLYNNAKLAYKSRFVDVPSDSYYDIGEPEKIAGGDYSECDRFLAAALVALDEAGESNPAAIDLSITRAMYAHILHCVGTAVGASDAKKLFRAEIDMKNILSAARMRRLKLTRDEFISGGKVPIIRLNAAVAAESFSECFAGTPYEGMAEALEASGFESLQRFESDADDYLFYMTDRQVARIAAFQPFLNYYVRARIELKTIKTALVCIKTNSRELFYKRVSAIYG